MSSILSKRKLKHEAPLGLFSWGGLDLSAPPSLESLRSAVSTPESTTVIQLAPIARPVISPAPISYVEKAKDLLSAPLPVMLPRSVSEDLLIGKGPAAALLRFLSKGWNEDDRDTLERFNGWGEVAPLIDENKPEHAATRQAFHDLLTDNGGSDSRAWRAATDGVLYSYYTPSHICEFMWRIAQNLGFAGGAVLEPGCGNGRVLRSCPSEIKDQVHGTGIDIDPTAILLAGALDGEFAWVCRPFQSCVLEPNFDLIIGNVPFGKIVLHDAVGNKDKRPIHEHFILKSLGLLKTGGISVLITSRHLLDKQEKIGRQLILDQARVLGVYRLPNRALAATDVLSDIIVLQKTDRPTIDSDFLETKVMDYRDPSDPDRKVRLSKIFDTDRGTIFGELRVAPGQFGPEINVKSTRQDLAEALNRPIQIVGGGDTLPYPAQGWIMPAKPRSSDESWIRPGSYYLGPQREILIFNAGGDDETPDIASYQISEVHLLIGLRDAARRVLNAQLQGETGYSQQQILLAKYTDYTQRHGCINRFTWMNRGIDAETGEEKRYKKFPKMGGFRSDPDFGLVQTIERYDEDNDIGVPGALCSQQIIGCAEIEDVRGRPDEALLLSLDRFNKVDIDYISEITEMDANAVISALNESIIIDPATSGWVERDDFLSGNIANKISFIEEQIAAGKHEFSHHLVLLKGALPAPLSHEQIEVQMGASWIESKHYSTFARHLLESHSLKVSVLDKINSWKFQDLTWEDRRGDLSTIRWGTTYASAIDLLEDILNNRITTVTEVVEGVEIKNPIETANANLKIAEIREEFARWIWTDDKRRDDLVIVYNRMFNSDVERRYNGAHLRLQGVNTAVKLREHQKNVIWRILRRCLQNQNTLMGHAVGAGKTYAAAAACMEQKRLGMASKPAIIVPNHMLEQFSLEIRDLYPLADVLVARDINSLDDRRKFIARCASHPWDVVVMTHSMFGRLGVDLQWQIGYMKTIIVDYREALGAVEKETGNNKMTAKRLRARIKKYEEKMKSLLERMKKDDGVRFDETGIDFIYVDEAHLFKNTEITTANRELAKEGSQRATDLMTKIAYLKDKSPSGQAVFMTGTPISNSLSEMYVMMNYLDQAVLREKGVAHFDRWAQTFAATVTELELSPEGGSYRMNTRFAKFVNVPELTSMYRRSADIQTTGMLNIPRPALKGGGNIIVIAPCGPTLKKYVQDLGERAEKVRRKDVEPQEDNMLKITTDGRKAALDLRLVNLIPDVETKAMLVAKQIMKIHEETKDRTFTDRQGFPSATPGALQMVMCDLGTPSGDRFSVYTEVRKLLIEAGMAPSAIRFIHQAPNNTAKAKLFADCRDGRVSVILGSTEKMGVGTNVQLRLYALHHIDAPWRPSDIEQREGRISRQGNQNPEILIYRYATEASFDIYMWQTLERKAKFIAQVMCGDPTMRSIDDIDGAALSFSEVKALATGNPLVVRQAGVSAELSRLIQGARNHSNEQRSFQARIREGENEIVKIKQYLVDIKETIERITSTRGDLFNMTIDNIQYTKRKEAGAALYYRVLNLDHRRHRTSDIIAGIGGFTVTLEPYGANAWYMWLNTPYSVYSIVNSSTEAAGLISMLEHKVNGFDSVLDSMESRLAHTERQLAQSKAQVGTLYPHRERLLSLEAELREIEQQLAGDLSDGDQKRLAA
jgi:N12 class adenine-specific DNA methylase